jgi:DNA topoisomerase I
MASQKAVRAKTGTPSAEPIFDITRARLKINQGKRANWWRRKGTKPEKFKYLKADGTPVTDEKSLRRISSLVIPPAWKCVRISPSAGGKVQAIGIDKSGRVQYIYHPKFAARQQQKKFAKIEKFGAYLPQLRRMTNEHLALDGFPREKVLALMIRLINSLYMRIGTEKSVKYYRTYGITTLQNRHLEIGENGKLVFSFVGKHHIRHRKVLVDEEFAGILQDLKALGSKGKLFHYLDADDRPRPVRPADINGYLKALTSPEFSVKDFRTWGATLLAAVELAEIGAEADEKLIRKNLVSVVKNVAEQLGNTPTVCRGSYIHPAVLEAYQNGITLEEFVPKNRRRIKKREVDNSPEEAALLKLLESNSKS